MSDHVQPPAPIRTILVPTDFSESASRALRAAIRIARPREARIEIVHAVRPSDGQTRLDAEVEDALGRSLASQAEACEEEGVSARVHHRVGKAWDVVGAVAAEIDADLIVIGARGRTDYRALLLGSTADRVIRTARAPVLTIDPRDESDRAILSVALVAIDFSDASRRAAETARRLVAGIPGGGRMVLLHAWQPLAEYAFSVSTGLVPNVDDPERERVAAALKRLAATLGGDGIEVESVVRHGYPAAVIEREADAIAADFIALGTQGRTGLEHIMIGSVAERVVHQAICPVLTVRAVE